MFKRLFYLALSGFFIILSCDNEPYEGPLNLDIEITCEDAVDILDEAESNFANVNSNNYTENCEAYKAALESYINTCEDNSNEIAALLNDLGNCELTSFFQVDFDGATFFATNTEASFSQGQISIKGIRGNEGETVALIINATSEGTYALGNTTNGQVNLGLYSPNANTVNAWQSVNNTNQPQGEVTITEIDYFNSRISGVFNFTAYDENNNVKGFTSGKFENLLFTKENSFFAKVDGQEFVDVQIVPGINNFGWVGLLARDAQNEEIFIGVNYNILPGTYNFDPEPLGQRNFDYSPSFQDFHYGDGTITILVHNTETNFLMGTFSCTAVSENNAVTTYEITEGEFCVTYLDGTFED